jgi:hypothetical protein
MISTILSFFHYNYGWTPDIHHRNEQPFRVWQTSEQILVHCLRREPDRSSAVSNPRMVDFGARAWFLSIGALKTHRSREAMLLAVTVLCETICGTSVPNYFSRFQALRLECVMFVIWQCLPISIFFMFIQLLKQMHSWFFFIIRTELSVELVTLTVPSQNVLISITTGNVTFSCSNHCFRESVIWTRLSWNKVHNVVQISGESIPIGSSNLDLLEKKPISIIPLQLFEHSFFHISLLTSDQ